MGLGERLGLVFSNMAMLIPVFIILATTAVLSAIGAAKLAKLKRNDTIDNARKWVNNSTIALWAIFGGVLIFSFTIGLAVLPTLVSMPYLYGGILILFALVNLTLAGMLLYGANAARTSDEYKAGDSNAKSAFNNLLICGILMVVAAIFMIGYTVYTIVKYRRGGGFTGDIAVAAEVAPLILGPEAIPISKAVGGMVQEPTPEPAQRGQPMTAKQKEFLNDPELLAQAMRAFSRA